MKLEDLDFENFFSKEEFNYEPIVGANDTVADVIFNFLFNSNNTIEVNSIEAISPEIINYYKEKLSRQVSKGFPIHFFLTTFTPKFKLQEQTNFNIFPDISDLFTLVHLQKMAKTIRSIYPYNFKFTVIFRGDSYKNLGFWTDEEMNTTFNNLKKMNKIAENITGATNSVVLMKWDDFLGDYAEDFKKKLYEKSNEYYSLWKDKKEPYYNQTESWKENFEKYLGTNHSDPFFTEFFTKEACKIRALNNLMFKKGEVFDLIEKSNPNLLIANTNKNTEFFSINLNPKFRKLSHFYLTTKRNGTWEYEEWKNIKDEKKLKPIYFKEFDYPMYFQIFND